MYSSDGNPIIVYLLQSLSPSKDSNKYDFGLSDNNSYTSIGSISLFEIDNVRGIRLYP